MRHDRESKHRKRPPLRLVINPTKSTPRQNKPPFPRLRPSRPQTRMLCLHFHEPIEMITTSSGGADRLCGTGGARGLSRFSEMVGQRGRQLHRLPRSHF